MDAEEHGPIAEELLTELAGTDRGQWRRATEAASRGIESRLRLWDELLPRMGVLLRPAPPWTIYSRRPLPLIA
jgi:hypothetical protein